MKCSTRKIQKAFENATPNVLGSILADCGAKDSQPQSVVPVKKPSRFLNFAASAAALLLLAGIGAGIASIVIANRTQYATTPTEDTTDPTTVEDLNQLNNAIIYAYCHFVGYAYDSNEISVRHYWNQDGIYAFYIDGIQEYEPRMTSHIYRDREFLFLSDQMMYFYHDGNLLPITRAFYEINTSGFTDELFNDFYNFHVNEHKSLYDPANHPKTELNCPALLTPEKRIKIEQTYGWDYIYTDDLWYTNGNFQTLRYYGSDNGYDILFDESGMVLMGETIKVIAGQAFGHVNSFMLYAHKDGELIPLDDAYNTGLVSKEAIKLAREYHNQCTSEEMISTCRPEPTKRSYEQYVEEAWSKISDEPFGTWYSEDNPNGDWRFYVDYILFYCGGEQEEVFTTIEIAGSTFSHPTTFKLYQMQFGTVELIELTEVEETYYLKRMAAEAAEQHVQCQKAAFGENWPLGSQTPAHDGTVSEGFAIEMGMSIVQNDTNMERKDIILENCQIINDSQGDYYRLKLLSDESVYTIDVRINGGELLNVSISDRPPDPNALSQEEFDEISELLTTHGSWMNMALIQPYTNSKEITIWTLFFNGFPDESREPTDLERELLSEDPFFDFEQIFIRVPLDRIDGILLKYFGITLEDADQVALDSIMEHNYLEETNCYYLCIPEYGYADVEVTKGLHRDDGTIAVYYEYFDGYYYSTRRVILKPTDDGYHILSNIPETWEEYEE